MEIVFEREALYKEVWTTPLTKLGEKYGLSDNGIRKVCKALRIPLPQRGYWAKITAGQSVPTPPLESTDGRTHFVCRLTPASPPSPERTEQEAWLKEKISFENEPCNKVIVQTELTNPHPLVTKTLRSLKEYRATLEKSRKRAEAPPKSSARWEPNFEVFSHRQWDEYLRKGVIELTGEVLPLRVSLDSIDRSLRLWDALIKACEQRGMASSIKENRLHVTAQGEAIELRLSERIERVIGPTKGMSELDVLFNKHVKNVATGELRIFVWCRGTETKFSDNADKPLEDQLNELLCKVYKFVVREIEWRALHEEQQRLRKIDDERREAERAAREELRQRREEEKRREESLIAEASAWHQASLIRAYVAHIQLAASSMQDGNCSNENLRTWLAWASEVAERIDPTRKRV